MGTNGAEEHPMFERNQERHERVERLFEILCGMSRGDLLQHEEAEKVLGIQRGNTYYAIMDKLRRRMERESRPTLVTIGLVGYAVALPKEQLGFAQRRIVKARRQTTRAIRTVSALPVEECDPIVARAKFGMEETLAAREKELRKAALLSAQLMRPREPGVCVADAG